MITNLRLQNFRSYKDASFEFDPAVNIIVGPNASGKTNLLEAIMVLCSGGSFRAKDAELVSFNAPWARLDAELASHSRSLKLEKTNDTLTKSFVIDDNPYRRLGFERSLPVVLFEPNHLMLIGRGPEQRRDYFDDLLARTKPGYKTLSANYRRALAQRNALLKKGPAYAGQQLFAWNVRLGELGSQIAAARKELIEDLNKKLPRVYSQIARRKSQANITYDNQFPIDRYASRLVSKLEQTAHQDLMRGFTGHGPHREDIIFYLDGQLAAHSASRGEARSLLLALKTIELDLIKKARGTKPVFLLDDVFSELDGSRRRALVEHLSDHQTIITTTDADAVLEYFSKGNNLIALG